MTGEMSCRGLDPIGDTERQDETSDGGSRGLDPIGDTESDSRSGPGRPSRRVAEGSIRLGILKGRTGGPALIRQNQLQRARSDWGY